MATNQRRRPSGGSSSRGGKSSGSSPNRNRQPGRPSGNSGKRGGYGGSSGRGGRPSGGSPKRNGSYGGRKSAYPKRKDQRGRKYKDGGFSAFFKLMTAIAVVGLIAALYFGGYLNGLKNLLPNAESLGNIGLLDSFTSSSSTAAPSVETTLPAATTTTRVTATTAETTTTTVPTTTTTTAAQESGTDADYVESPDYDSPYYIIVFTGSQSVVVYGKDADGHYNVKTKCFTCSSGASGTPTRTGLYSIIRTYRWRALMGDVYGQYCSGFSSSYLFHSILYEDTDESTMFPNSYRNLGTAASHGCVRLCVRDAKWIFDNCPKGTQVHVVKASGPEGESYLPELKDGSKYYGWDPTDPNEDNPYNN